MGLELGHILIQEIQFGASTEIEDGRPYVNKKELIELIREDWDIFSADVESYDGYSNDIVNQIVNNHLNKKGDDGRASNVRVEMAEEGDIIRIHVDIEYEGNDHTTYEEKG